MHVRRHGDGWRVIVQHGGRRRSALANTKADAQRRGAELLLEMGAPTDTTTMTLHELITLHIDQAHLAATTTADYLSIRDRLPEWMASWEISIVTPHLIDQAYHRLATDGWSAHRIKRLHTILRPAFRRAHRYGWVTGNPILSADAPAPADSEIHAPTPDEVQRLVAAADRHDLTFGCALRVLATTGIRRGELCGLHWDDINLDDSRLTVRRSVSTVVGSPHIVTEGKTGAKGHRTIALDPFTVAALKAHSARQAAFILKERMERPPWVFTSDYVNPWRADYVTRTFDVIRTSKGVGLKHVRLHDLRHFAATQLLGGKVDVRTVAGRLGHARPATTLNKYASFLPARDREAANLLGDLLGD